MKIFVETTGCNDQTSRVEPSKQAILPVCQGRCFRTVPMRKCCSSPKNTKGLLMIFSLDIFLSSCTVPEASTKCYSHVLLSRILLFYTYLHLPRSGKRPCFETSLLDEIGQEPLRIAEAILLSTSAFLTSKP